MSEAAHSDWRLDESEWQGFLFAIGDHPEWSQFGNLSELEARKA